MKNYLINRALFSLALESMLFISCYKKFDPKSYQPAFTVNGFTSSASIQAANLVAYWAFEGNYMDSVSGTVGTGVNTGFAAGFVGQAMQGAANGYVIADLPNTLQNLSSFTVDLWVNTPQPTGATALMSINDNSAFWGAMDVYYDGISATSASYRMHLFNATDNVGELFLTSWSLLNPWGSWQNLAITYDENTSTFTLYQNGTLIGSQVQNGEGAFSLPATATNIIFGTFQFQCTPSLGTAGGTQDWAGYIPGLIDEVRIYNKALTQTELQALVTLQGKGK
jgi:hypothetical protein